MVLSNQQIVEIYEGLYELRAAGQSSLPVSVGFLIVKAMKELQNSYETIMEVKGEIGSKYGVLQDDGSYFVEAKDRAAAGKEIDDLMAIQSNINLDLIPLSLMKEVSVPLDIIYNIYPIINGEA